MPYPRLDPIISLSVALAEAPGTCACLLGAGVSVDAGIPTGWDIYRDGLRRLYRLETQSAETPVDEEIDKWVAEQGLAGLEYSTLIDRIAPDQAIRRELIAGYFEGKVPGGSHERLAELAKMGVLKVFVTTNFDRLFERALVARGIDPVIVSDDATLLAAPRREHADVFIVKAHGDILQETIRNTPSELSMLGPQLTEELRVIVDHYGLLVIGWSGSDPALGEIVRKRTSRYGSWWLLRGESPREPARTLIEVTGARTIVRVGAGDFLAELERRMAMYSAYASGDDPGSVHDEVLELVRRGDDVAVDVVLRRERNEFESALDAVRSDYGNRNLDDDTVSQGWALIAAATDRRLGALIPLALYRDNLLDTEIRSHAAWATSAPARSGSTAWLEPWRLPFWMIGMTIGGLAVRLGRYGGLPAILSSSWSTASDWDEPFVGFLSDLSTRVAALFGPVPPQANKWTSPDWKWFLANLSSKEWLVERYPEWLRRDEEPARALAAFSLLMTIAAGLRDGRELPNWWTLQRQAAEAYAKHLHRDRTTREGVSEALGVSLDAFDEKAPDIIRSARGLIAFPETERVANMLETGKGANAS